jgi:manganese-dependent inorganic pyrophosphatase
MKKSFRSPTTTDDDRNVVKFLQPLAKIDDLQAYAGQMFEAKSDLTGFSAKKILLLDYKTFHFNDQHWGVGSGETCNLDKMLERKDELLKEMDEEKKRSHLNGILFCMIDIIKENNLTLIPGPDEEKMAREVFKVDVKDHIADLGSRISRKKQIIPALEAYFNPKS